MVLNEISYELVKDSYEISYRYDLVIMRCLITSHITCKRFHLHMRTHLDLRWYWVNFEKNEMRFEMLFEMRFKFRYKMKFV